MKTRIALALGLVGLFVLAAIQPRAHAAKETFDRSKPHLSISVQAQGVDLGGFDQVTGLGVETEVVEFRDGSDPVVRKLPGRTKYSNITLKRGYQGAPDVEAWATEAAMGGLTRRNVQIRILEPSAAVVRTFNLIDCFPARWSVSTNDQGLAIEELTLAVELLEIAD